MLITREVKGVVDIKIEHFAHLLKTLQENAELLQFMKNVGTKDVRMLNIESCGNKELITLYKDVMKIGNELLGRKKAPNGNFFHRFDYHVKISDKGYRVEPRGDRPAWIELESDVFILTFTDK